jgi:hypothetical protein
MASLKSTFANTSLSDKATAAAAVGVVILGGIVTYRLGIWGNYNKGTDQNAGVSVKESNLSDKSKIKYKNIADSLYQEMNKTGWTKFSNLYPMLQSLNDDELKQVVKEFGTRASTVPFTNFALSGEKYNLFTWFEREIYSSDNLKKMKRLFEGTNLWSASSDTSGTSLSPLFKPALDPLIKLTKK